MQTPHDRARDTQELIERFRDAAARRRRMRWISVSVAAVAVLCTVVAVVLSTRPHAAPSVVVQPTSTTTSLAAVEPVSSTLHTTTVSEVVTTSGVAVGRSYVVVIDPGHQAKPNSEQEPIGPGSADTKAKVSSGTRSVNTGSPESELVLTVALKLRDALEAEGVQVIMTRTTQDLDISNVQRARIANDSGADLFVRVHADGAADPSVRGVLVLYPASIPGWTDDIAAESERAARMALDALVAATGAERRGLSERSDIAGFNWSDVPVILPEIGLMTNPEEDALLAASDYQDKIVRGLTEAILNYLGVR